MNYQYGFPLFESDDIVGAYNYLTYRDDVIDPGLNDLQNMYNILNDKSKYNYLIVSANILRVESITLSRLLPSVLLYLKKSGYDAGVATFDPNYIIKMYSLNPFFASQPIMKASNYIVGEMYGTLSSCLYFKDLDNKRLEQVINLKYREYVTYGKNGYLFIRISPQDNFSLIYSLIDDIFKYC